VARRGLRAARHVEAAERAFRRAIELNDARPEAWLLLGKLLLREGRLDEARETLLKAQALDSGNH